MIKESELRIGNLVSWGVKTVEISGIHTKSIPEDTPKAHFYVKGIVGDYYCVYPNDIEPIPLTEEWLLKFGFENKKSSYRRENVFKKGWFEVYFGKHAIYATWEPEIEIQYVHQLQNLYFALTGQELEIKEKP